MRIWPALVSLRAGAVRCALGVPLLAVTACNAASSATPPRPYGLGPEGEVLASPSAEVNQAYLAYWDAWLEANRLLDPRADQLANHAGEPNLSILRAALAENKRAGLINRGTVGHRIDGILAEGGLRRVYDCVDLSRWLIHDARTGKPIKQLTDREPFLSIMTMRQIRGTWKVTDIQKPLPCTEPVAHS